MQNGNSLGQNIEWTPHEAMLWETARIVGAVLRGERLAGQPTTFALSMSNDSSEVILASAPYSREWLGAIGDGSYEKSTTFVGGYGLFGIGLGAATLAGSAARNRGRKSRAAADASIVWRQLDQGALHVGNCGFYIDTEGSLLAFGYEHLQRMELIGPGSAQWTASMQSGTVETFRFASTCVELVFALWALARCPNHPQLLNFTWLPNEFMERVKHAGLIDQLGGGSLTKLA